MKRILALFLIFLLGTGGLCLAKEYDLENMNSIELNELKGLIEDELNANHQANSTQKTAVQNAIVAYVESIYGEDNVSWAWFDYSYTREWDFFTMKTHADIKKQDGGKAQYDIYGEVIASSGNYQAVYVMVGTEVLLDERGSTIADSRILSMLGLKNDTIEAAAQSTGEQADSTANSTEAAEETVPLIVAQRGDKNATVKSIQEMLIRLSYLSGSADGDFGGKTELAVQAFQKDNGFPEDGIVTQEIFEALNAAFVAAPTPIEYPHFTAAELYKKFEDNQLSAEAELDGKVIQITGTINSISESIWGTPYVNLQADSYGFKLIQCYFSSKQINELAQLKAGNRVTIQGSCGKMGIVSIEVKDCKLIG